MISELVGMLSTIILSIFILNYTSLHIFTRVSLLLVLLWVIQGITNEYEYRSSRTLSLSDIQPGTVINYSYVSLLNHSLNPIMLYRLLGNRYVHIALVVLDGGERKVLEWRFSPIKEFKEYERNYTSYGKVYLVPLEYYMHTINRYRTIFRITAPPHPVDISFDQKVVEEIGNESFLSFCSYFCMRYLDRKGVLSGQIRLTAVNAVWGVPSYLPAYCVNHLKSKEWSENYYVL